MKTLDLIDWTKRAAAQVGPEHHVPSTIDGAPSINEPLEVLEGGRVKPNADDATSQIASAPDIQMTIQEPRPDRVFPPSMPAAPSASADVRTEAPKSVLLMAIVDPGIYTARVDRDRAVALRWVLRDIRSNRLKWWSVNQDDLRLLIDMELVEMRIDEPVLTDAGERAISDAQREPNIKHPRDLADRSRELPDPRGPEFDDLLRENFSTNIQPAAT